MRMSVYAVMRLGVRVSDPGGVVLGCSLGLAACPKISWLAGWRASVGDNYSRRLQPLASQ